MFAPEQLANAIKLDVAQLESALFFNDGSGHFTMRSLPVEIQFSTTMAAETGDFNGDGKPDLLLGGNLYHVKPEVGRYDASYGHLLEGDGKGGFREIPPRFSGFRLEGEIRDIQTIETPTGTILLIARSNEQLQLFRPQEQGL